MKSTQWRTQSVVVCEWPLMQRSEYHNIFVNEQSHWWYIAQRELIKSVVRRESIRLGRALDIFDAGCGTGGLALQLQSFGSIEGVDYSKDAIEYCRQHRLMKLRQGDLNELELKPSQYDVVVSSDVLYHAAILDPADVVARMIRGLKPGGILVLHLEAFDCLKASHADVVHSARRFRLAQVRRMLAPHMEIEVLTYRVTALFPVVAAVRLLQKVFRGRLSAPKSDIQPVPDIVNRSLLAVTRFEDRLARRWRLPFGVSCFCVARMN
jgi:SAM-dependent methyltransferase